jgi:hypothetical protein
VKQTKYGLRPLVTILFIAIGFGINLSNVTTFLQREVFAQSQGRYGIPEDLKPSQLWVSSVPVGLDVEIYKGSKEIFLKGQTPITVELEPGRYVIEVIGNRARGTFERSFGIISDRPKDRPNGDVIAREKKEGGLEIFLGLPFEVEKVADKPMTLIVLFQPRVKSLDELDSLFPESDNFVFDEVAIKKILSEKGVLEQDIPKALSLLRRGGKLFLEGKGYTFIIEITASNNWKIIEEDIMMF